MISVATLQRSYYSFKQDRKKWARSPSHQTSPTDGEFHVSIINYYSFSYYFQPFKNIQSFVSSWTIQEQAVGLIWSVYPLHKTLQKQETLSSPKRIPQIPILPSLRWKISPWWLDNLINATGINLLIPDFLSYSICVATTQSCLFIFIFFSPAFWKQLWTAYKPTGIAVFQ